MNKQPQQYLQLLSATVKPLLQCAKKGTLACLGKLDALKDAVVNEIRDDIAAVRQGDQAA